MDRLVPGRWEYEGEHCCGSGSTDWHRAIGRAAASCSKVQERRMLSHLHGGSGEHMLLIAGSSSSLLILVGYEAVGSVEKHLLRDMTVCRWTSKLLDLSLPWGWAADWSVGAGRDT